MVFNEVSPLLLLNNIYYYQPQELLRIIGMNGYNSSRSMYGRTPGSTLGGLREGDGAKELTGGVGSIGAYTAWPTPSSMYSDNNGSNQQACKQDYNTEMPQAVDAVTAMLKVQKKGERETHLLPISAIKTWDDLITSIHRYYDFPSASPPSIATYEGDLLSSTNYQRFLNSKQHLILNFPIDHQARKQILQSLSSLQISNDPSPKTVYSSPRSPQIYSAYSPVEKLHSRAMKLAEGHDSVKAMAEHVRTMAEQTLEQFQNTAVHTTESLLRPGYQPAKSRTTPIYSPPKYSPAMSNSTSTSSQQGTSGKSLQSPFSTSSNTNTSQAGSDDDEAELNWSFSQDPSVWYSASDQWPTTMGKKELQTLGIPPIEDDYGLTPERKHKFGDNKLEHMLSPEHGTIPSPKSGLTEESSADPPFEPQSDHVETPEAHHILLCPHLTFHSLKPMDLKISITPTITVIPPTTPQDHERFFATSVGEKIDLALSIKHNGKITEAVSRPEGKDQTEPITLLQKSQGKGAGGKWHISRMDTQLEGGWGKAQVGALGGDGSDGKKRNGGEIIDFGFKGEENGRRSFALAFDKVGEFLDLFMDTCGFPKRERNTMTSFWGKRLPKEASDEFFLLVKIQPVKTMISLLPIVVEPAPDRAVRFFLTMKIMSRQAIKDEKLDIAGVMSDVVQEVLDKKIRPIVPATAKGRGKGKGGKKTVGTPLKATASRTTASTAKMQEELAEIVEGPKSGLTIFEYGGILIATKDMLVCNMPKEPQEDCGSPLAVLDPLHKKNPAQLSQQLNVAAESENEDDDSDGMDVDYDSDPSTLRSSNSGSTPLSNSTTGTSPTSGHDSYMADWSFQQAPQMQQRSPPEMPSTYWTGNAFPIQEQQKYNFGDYVPVSTYAPYGQPNLQQAALPNSHLFAKHMNPNGPWLSNNWPSGQQRYMQ